MMTKLPWIALFAVASSSLASLVQAAGVRGLSSAISNSSEAAITSNETESATATAAPSERTASDGATATAAPSEGNASTATEAPSDVVSSTPTAQDDLYTIIFISDMENKYRGHTTARSQFVANYVSRLAQEGQFFDHEYSDVPIDPQLIIHGGDIGHLWGCIYPTYIFGGGCRTPEDEFESIWRVFYDAGIPLISAYGNHDWRAEIGTGNPTQGTPRKQRTAKTDKINIWSSKFVEATYQKSADMGAITYQSIPPTGEIGQSMYRAEFRGLQIASFNAAYNWQSYDDNGIYSADDQFERLAQTLNRNQSTIFFSHFPLSATRLKNQTPTPDQVKDLIRQFPVGTPHFVGHYHVNVIERHEDLDPAYYDIVAPYPHNWNGNAPGYLAVLVSKSHGVVQVKPMLIPGLDDGTSCEQVESQALSRLFRHPIRMILWKLRNNKKLDQINTCDRCNAGQQYWSVTALGWVCGLDPAVVGTLDQLGISIPGANALRDPTITEEYGDSLDGADEEE